MADDQGTPSATPVPLVQSDYQVDGRLDEPFWKQALAIDLPFEVDPAINAPAPQKTTAYLVDTGHSILVGFRAQDTQPQSIRARLRDRDDLFDDDFVGIILDTYNDNVRALEFFVNPLGAQADLIRDESRGDSDKSWDAIWNSAGRITQEGYEVEMEIPYIELQMPPTSGKKVWGITFLRSLPRDFRRQLMDRPLDRNNACFLCQSRRFNGFAGAKLGRDLEITPSFTAKAEQQRPVLSADYTNPNTNWQPSVDINWGISPNVTLNATINPDFSQVETDAAQLNVNETFALYYPERRPFFLENADYFRTRFNLIHTRNIADPDYGIRLVGKSGDNAWGAFLTNDNFTTVLLPGTFGSSLASLDRNSLDFAGRFRHDMENASTAGILMTHRSAENYTNSVVSADGRYRLSDSVTFDAQLAYSQTHNPPEITTRHGVTTHTQGMAIHAAFQHSSQNWNNRLAFRELDQDFRADLGFINKVGYREISLNNRYSWFGPPNGWWSRVNTFFNWDYSQTENRRLLENKIVAGSFIHAMKQSRLGLIGVLRKRLWNSHYFDEKSLGLRSSIRPSSRWQLGLGIRRGDTIDFANNTLGMQDNIDMQLTTNLGIHFTGSINHNYRHLQRDKSTVFTANQTDARLSWQFDIRQRLRLALVYTRVNRNPAMYDTRVNQRSTSLNTQLIYSYKLNPKTLIYLGYSDGARNDDATDTLRRTNRTLFAKFSYAWKS